MSEIAQALQRVDQEDREALDRLFAESYPELKRIAHARLRSSGLYGELQTTALVHDSYVKLASGRGLDFPDRGRFLAYASRVLRTILIDIVRERRSQRRGGELEIVTLDTAAGDGSTNALDVEELNRALEEMARLDGGLARLVEMRFFGGLSDLEIGEALGVSESTAYREWLKARMLLHTLLGP